MADLNLNLTKRESEAFRKAFSQDWPSDMKKSKTLQSAESKLREAIFAAYPELRVLWR